MIRYEDDTTVIYDTQIHARVIYGLLISAPPRSLLRHAVKHADAHRLSCYKLLYVLFYPADESAAGWVGVRWYQAGVQLPLLVSLDFCFEGADSVEGKESHAAGAHTHTHTHTHTDSDTENMHISGALTNCAGIPGPT